MVIFPSTMGFTGEIYNKKGIKYDNAFGKLITKEAEATVEEDFDI